MILPAIQTEIILLDPGSCGATGNQEYTCLYSYSHPVQPASQPSGTVLVNGKKVKNQEEIQRQIWGRTNAKLYTTENHHQVQTGDLCFAVRRQSYLLNHPAVRGLCVLTPLLPTPTESLTNPARVEFDWTVSSRTSPGFSKVLPFCIDWDHCASGNTQSFTNRFIPLPSPVSQLINHGNI